MPRDCRRSRTTRTLSLTTSGATPPPSGSYAYNGFGNLTHLGGRSIGVNHATNRLTGSSYDTAGNELSWGTGSLTYHYTYYPTGEVRTTSGGSPELTRIFAYTADGERIAASISAGPDTGINYTVRDLEGHVVRHFLESGGTWRWKEDFVWGPTGLNGVRYMELVM